MGVTPVVVGVFDERQLHAAIVEARPQIVIHQLTDLQPGLHPAKMADGVVRNARIRDIGTRQLIAGAAAAGVERMIVQSIAFAYESGPMPYHGSRRSVWPLLLRLSSKCWTRQWSALSCDTGGFMGRVRVFDVPSGAGGPIHVDAVADAARRAVTRGKDGIYNVAEDDGMVSSHKAIHELGWDAGTVVR